MKDGELGYPNHSLGSKCLVPVGYEWFLRSFTFKSLFQYTSLSMHCHMGSVIILISCVSSPTVLSAQRGRNFWN